MNRQLLTFLVCLSGLAPQIASAADATAFYRATSSSRQGLYTVKDGETLFHIAERVLGDPYRAKELADRNRIADPLRIAPGTRLEIPTSPLAIRYWVEKIDPEGEISEAGSNDRYEPGDRFQLRLAANADGYLYIFNRSASGEVRRLFPSGNRAIKVRAFSEYLLPAKGLLQLDNSRGNDELWVILSPDRLSDLDALFDSGLLDGAGGGRVRRYVDSPDGSKGIVVIADDSADEPETRVAGAPADNLLAHRIIFRRR